MSTQNEHIDINDRDKYLPFVIEDFTPEMRKFFAVLSIKKKADEADARNKVILLVAENQFFETAKLNSQNSTMEVVRILQGKNYSIAKRLDVSLDKIKEIYEKARGFGGNEKEIVVQGEAAKMFDSILAKALEEGASDIHIEALTTGATVDFRIDGDLKRIKTISYEFVLQMIRAIYSVEGQEMEGTHFNEGDHQSTVIKKRINGVDLQLRFQSIKIFNGFKVVMRILILGKKEDSDDKLNYLKLDKLGYAASQVEDIELGTAKPVGATVIAGVTGSGKSTTLKNLLMAMNHQGDFLKSYYTLEDPTEYLIPGVSQISVSRNIVKGKVDGFTGAGGSPFKKPLAVLMRSDPDVIMIGEIRDEATAEGLVKATESGHKVLTTTHASSALEIVKRIYGFGVDSNDMAAPSFLSCLIYQKLLPVLCEHCKEKLSDKLEDSDVDERLVMMKKRLVDVCDLNKDHIYVRSEKGCPHCSHRGVKGRTVCAETIIPDLTLLTFFRDNKMIEAKEYWRSLSDRNRDSQNFTGKTVLEHAISKMRKGIISPIDVENELGPINSAHKEWLEIEKRERKERENRINQYIFGSKNMASHAEKEEIEL